MLEVLLVLFLDNNYKKYEIRFRILNLILYQINLVNAIW
jgi:hypothetical protein